MVYFIYIRLTLNHLSLSPFINTTILIIMNYLVCKKHNKLQKTPERAFANGFVCLNKNCHESMKLICSVCKNEHRDHTNHLFNLQNTSHLLQQLVNAPFEQMTKSLGETLDIMKKLKLIKEFRNKIDILEKQIQKQSLELINKTQSLLQQYHLSTLNLQSWSPIVSSLKNHDSYRQFSQNTAELFHSIDYNVKKTKLQFQNHVIREKEQKRKKIMETAIKKIGEVRDYSMKIIQVILHNEDSDEEQEEISYKRKHYQCLKQELFSEKENQFGQLQAKGMKKSRVTTGSNSTNSSRIRNDNPYKGTQTQIKTFTEQQLKEQIQQLKRLHIRNEGDLKLKLNAVVRQKDNLNRQLNRIKQIS